jgi:hypothetical protein
VTEPIKRRHFPNEFAEMMWITTKPLMSVLKYKKSDAFDVISNALRGLIRLYKTYPEVMRAPVVHHVQSKLREWYKYKGLRDRGGTELEVEAMTHAMPEVHDYMLEQGFNLEERRRVCEIFQAMFEYLGSDAQQLENVWYHLLGDEPDE